MKKICIIASHNQGKVQEFTKLLASLPLDIEWRTLADYPELEPVEETGTTFVANAKLKAETIAQATGHYVLADDSGLVVPALNGEPGVYSARYAGESATDEENWRRLLDQIEQRLGVNDKPPAYFQTVLALSHPDHRTITARGRIDGQITRTPHGNNGFGYDPIFFVPELNQTFAQLSPEEKNKYSHRARAIEKLKKKLMKKLGESAE